MNAKGHLSNEYNKNINTKAKAKKYFLGINFTLISLSTVLFPTVPRPLPRNALRIQRLEDLDDLGNDFTGASSV